MSNNDETAADSESINDTSIVKDDAGCTPKKPRTECVNNDNGNRIIEILTKSKNLQTDAPRSERKKSSLMKSKFEFMGLKRKSASMASDVVIFSGDIEKSGRFTRQRNKGKKGDVASDFVVVDRLSVDKNHNEKDPATVTITVTSTETAADATGNAKLSKEDRRRSQHLTISNHITELPAATANDVTPQPPRTKSLRSMWQAGSRRRSTSVKTDRPLAPAMRTDAGHTPLKMRRRRHGTEFNERLIN